MVSLLQRTCLRPTDSLRRQLMLSFGISAFLTLLMVVVVTNLAALQTSRAVKQDAERALRDQVVRNVDVSTANIAEKLTATFKTLEGTVQIMAEITQDRMAGYKDDGWEDDNAVPFFDMESGRNVYPLKSPPLPLDWQVDANIYQYNAEEHLQDRAFWINGPANEGSVSSVSSSYIFQGVCNPSVSDPDVAGYYPNCTDENNNVTSGGIKPTSTSKALYDKAADLGVLLKPLFEAQPFIFSAGIYFHNEGAGASLNYPGYRIGTGPGYISTGCEWMRNINPYTNEPFGTDEEIARCHPNGTMVSLREQNPMERGYCEAMASKPDHIVKYGPFVAINRIPTLQIGRSVFDRG